MNGIFQIILAALCLTLCGCESLIKPTDVERRASFEHAKAQLSIDPELAKKSTCVVITGDAKLAVTLSTSDAAGHSHLSITNRDSHDRLLGSFGLAVCVEPDGYLLTAGHVPEEKVYVLGWFGGKPALQTARVVYKLNEHAIDLAVLKVDARPDYILTAGNAPTVGDCVCAVGFFHQDNFITGSLDLMGGQIIGTNGIPGHDEFGLINTDVPLWRGDSGGPLFSSSGKLLGIASKLEWSLHLNGWKKSREFMSVDNHWIQNIIVQDRKRP